MDANMLLSGLVAGAKLAAEAAGAVGHAWDAVKRLLSRKYPDVPLAQLEAKPGSAGRQIVVKEELEETGAANDPEFIALVEGLLAAIREHAPAAAEAYGLHVTNVKARNLETGKVEVTGPGNVTGVRIADSEFTDDIRLGDVSVKAGGPDPNR